jgi:hypothetical protein
MTVAEEKKKRGIAKFPNSQQTGKSDNGQHGSESSGPNSNDRTLKNYR